MAKLSTQFMGMELKNPVLAAPGPWTGTAEGLQAAIDAGAGAVMTETISQEVYPRLPQTCYHEGGAVFSTSLYSNLTLEQWEVELEKLHPGDCKVIASIRWAPPSELAYVVRTHWAGAGGAVYQPGSHRGAGFGGEKEGFSAADGASAPLFSG